MCGICGIHGPHDEALLRRMTGAIAHRGPDDAGFYRDGSVGLGIRRLSIIDVTGGHQPLANEVGSLWIVYNGEIYNFQEIRKTLEAKGHRFTTRSDTEVILHAFEEYGEACVHLFRGMFAFALWDAREGTLRLCRDLDIKVGVRFTLTQDNFADLPGLLDLVEAEARVRGASFVDLWSDTRFKDAQTH